MTELLHPYLQMPTLPFTVLLGLVVAYWLLMIVSGLDLDFLDFDFDLDGDPTTHHSGLAWGFAGLQWFNLGDVPVMVWLSIFALAAWLTSAIFDKQLTDPTTSELLTATVRNIGVALIAAKAITQPLKGKLKIHEPNTVEQMIGRAVVITSSEADTTHGQATCPSDGAPLLINVRTIAGSLAKGDAAEIVDYSPEERVYFIRSAAQSMPEPPAERSL